MVLDINRRTIKAMINMLMAYYSKHDIPMIHAYLKWYLDPNEQYNFIVDLEMTAQILKERNATFLIELISQHHHGWRISSKNYVMRKNHIVKLITTNHIKLNGR